jgi:uncharacterized damage-inducible protein DinB
MEARRACLAAINCSSRPVSVQWNRRGQNEMNYEHTAIPPDEVPRALMPEFQHMLDIYASETNKVISVWCGFNEVDLDFRPHPRSSSVQQILEHQLLSERRFFGEFLGSMEPPPAGVLPADRSPAGFISRMEQLARPRLAFLAGKDASWWLAETRFFDTSRSRIWIFWRRVLHTAHHRTQLTVYLRLLDKPVVATYGPTADVTWAGADPTVNADAAGRK